MKKNIIYNFTYQLLLAILPIITAPYIARIFGPELQGTYSYTYAIVNYYALFIMLGLKNYGNRAIAQVRNNQLRLSKTFFEIYYLQCLCFILTILFYFIYIFCYAPDQYKTLYLIQVLVLFSYLFDISWFYFGIEQFKFTIFRNTLIKVVTVGCIFLFVKNSTDFNRYVLIMSLSMLISSLSLWTLLFKKIIYTNVTVKSIARHIKPNVLLFIPVIGISIYKLLSKILLGTMGSLYDLGLYENADKIILIIIGLLTSIGAVMLPRLSNLAANGEVNQLKNMTRRTLEGTFFVSLGISAILFCVSDTFPLWFFGEKYQELSIVLPLLGVTIPFVAWANVLRTQYLIPMEKDKEYIFSIVIGAIINLITNIMLIPELGIYGALLATVATEVFVCIYQTYSVRKYLPVGEYLKNNLPFIVSALLMVFAVRTIRVVLPEKLLVRLLLEGIIGSFVYLGISLAMIIGAKGKLMAEEYALGIKLMHKIKKK